MNPSLLTLDVECPKCGTKPNLRVTEAFLELVRQAPSGHTLGTWECQGPRCGHRIVLTTGAVQRATLSVDEVG